MSRGLRTLIVLLIALGAAGAATFMVYRAVKNVPVRRVEVAQMQIAVAAAPIPVGTIVTRDKIKMVGWPAGSPVAGAFTSIDAAVDRGAVVSIDQNEPLTESKLAPKDAGGGLPPTIPIGMRALSVKVNEVIGVAGFVVPGTHVDVIATVSKNQDSSTRTVVSNLLVLTAGTRIDQEASRKEGKPIPTTVVTLAVTPPDAERIALAATEAQITLALRNPLDAQPTETTGVRLASLMAGPAPPPIETTQKGRRVIVPVRIVPPPPPPKPYTVETIRGAKRTEETIK
jgi:pilus assembly protein CpaB